MFNTNIKRIFLITLLFLFLSLILFYWKYPTVNQKQDFNTIKYSEILKKIQTNNPQDIHELEHFIINNHNIYSTLASLSLSKKYILHNQLNKALILLNNSLKYTKEENLKILLELNIAKIKIEKNQNQQAIEILNNIKNHNWNNIVENMKGDIFKNINNKKEAIKSWKKSLLIENSNASKEIIQMKINDIKE